MHIIKSVLIIDDEDNAREVLQIILEQYCSNIEVIHEADNLMSGIEIIKKHNPEIVFLDIEMPEYSGLQILEFLEKDDFNFDIIFTTAYSKYALEAFELSAIDYLLKPLRPNQVKKAIEKFQKISGKTKTYEKLKGLTEGFLTTNFNKLALPLSDSIYFVELEDIICIEANRMYTNVHTVSREVLLISKPLKYFEDLLKNNQTFYRTHRSYIINLKFIKQLFKKDGGYIIMEKDIFVSLSREKKKEFFSLFNS